jgi:hypothetical protein
LFKLCKWNSAGIYTLLCWVGLSNLFCFCSHTLFCSTATSVQASPCQKCSVGCQVAQARTAHCLLINRVFFAGYCSLMHHHLIIAEAHKRYGGMGTLLVNKVCQQYSTNFHISSLQTSDIQSYKSILMHNIIPKIFLRYLQSQLTNLAS